MNIFERMANIQAMQIIYIIIGVVVRKCGIIELRNRTSYNHFILYITFPALILSSFLQDIPIFDYSNIWIILSISLLGWGFSYFLGLLLWHNRSIKQRGVLMYGALVSNGANIGLPIVQQVFGDEGALYASLYLIPLRILTWTIGLSLFVSGRGKRKMKNLILNPSLIVVFVGLGLMLSNTKLPYSITEAIKRVGNMSGPLSMIFIGTTIAEFNFKDAFSFDSITLTLLRLFIIPIVLLSILKQFFIYELVVNVSVILLAMPVATTTVVLTERYDGDYILAVKVVFLSTILSFIYIPIITLLI